MGLTSLLRVSRASFYEYFICARWECLPRVISHTTWKIHELLYVCSYQSGLCLIFPFPQVASTRGSLQKVSPAVVPAVFCPCGSAFFLTHSTVFLALVARCAVSLFRVVSFARPSCLSLGISFCCSLPSTPLTRVAGSDYVIPCLACLPFCLVCRLSPLLTIVTLVARPPNSRNLGSSQAAPVLHAALSCCITAIFHSLALTASDLTALAHPQNDPIQQEHLSAYCQVEASPAALVAQLAATDSYERPFPGRGFPRATERPTPSMPMTD